MARPPESRAGFALPLALFAVVVLVLMASMLVGAGLHETRVARDSALLSRAEQLVESALASLLESDADSSLVFGTPGTARTSVSVSGFDSVRTALTALGGARVRATILARAHEAERWSEARVTTFLRIAPDSVHAAGPLRLTRLPGRWWEASP